jgi:hypothetical protein
MGFIYVQDTLLARGRELLLSNTRMILIRFASILQRTGERRVRLRPVIASYRMTVRNYAEHSLDVII